MDRDPTVLDVVQTKKTVFAPVSLQSKYKTRKDGYRQRNGVAE